MQAIEFEAFIKGGLIQIPSYYQNLDNMKAKVIVLFPFEKTDMNYNKAKLKNAFKKAQEKTVFKTITDSVTWQKQLRDEWE